MTKQRVFKCAESEEHVKEANVQVSDVLSAFEFFIHFKIPTKWSKEKIVKILGDGTDIALNHDVAHEVIEDLVIAYDNGNEILRDEFMVPVMEELKKKQLLCKHGA